ncbi:hypothetical protein V1515DRAFT_142857 [Lipomyces mesembrius]
MTEMCMRLHIYTVSLVSLHCRTIPADLPVKPHIGDPISGDQPFQRGLYHIALRGILEDLQETIYTSGLQRIMAPQSLESAHRDALIRLIHLSLLRNDLPLARRCIALLLRTRPSPPRTPSPSTATLLPFWPQLLALAPTSRARATLLDWLLVSLASYVRLTPRHVALSNRRARAKDQVDSLYTAFACLKIEGGAVDDLVDRLEEILLEWPFSEDARLRGYYGMALLSVNRTSEGTSELAKCEAAGWTVPDIVFRKETAYDQNLEMEYD